MSLEEIKKLIEHKNIIVFDLNKEEKIEDYLNKLNPIKNYKMMESIPGGAPSMPETHSLAQILKIADKNPSIEYIIIPIKEN
jgi:hypothetical protein